MTADQPPTLEQRSSHPRTDIDWSPPIARRSLDKFVGPDATSAEILLQFSVAFAAAAVLVFAEARGDGGWSLSQRVVGAVLAFDLFGGVVTNATSAAKRWYHRADQTWRHHMGFILVHALQPALVVGFFAPTQVGFALASFGFVLAGALVILFAPLYLRRPLASSLVALAVVVGLYGLESPAYFEWFFPVYALKLLHAHLLFEAPFRPITASNP